MPPKRKTSLPIKGARAPQKSASQNWPADKVERWPIEKLTPYPRNARTHSEDQISQICASMREWGWTTPVLVDETGGIIAGHGRIVAAQRLGYAEVPVMIATGWTEAQKQAYVLADNKIALNAGWDEGLLNLELGELKGLDFDLAKIGFSDLELKALFAEPETPDASPQLQGLAYSVVVRCTDERQQSELLMRFESEGFQCDALIS